MKVSIVKAEHVSEWNRTPADKDGQEEIKTAQAI